VRKVIAGLIVLILALAAAVAWSNSNLEIGSAAVQELSPEFTAEALQAASSPLQLVIGDPKDSLGVYITGMRVKLTFNIENHSFIPAFSPVKRYTLFIGNLPVGEVDGTGSAWLGGGSTTPGSVEVLVPPGALRPDVVDVLMDGGTIELNVRAELGWGAATVLRESGLLSATPGGTIRAVLGLPDS
jgi:hypothetical protein